eukprot:6063509-Prymnesium_polylepis.1
MRATCATKLSCDAVLGASEESETAAHHGAQANHPDRAGQDVRRRLRATSEAACRGERAAGPIEDGEHGRQECVYSVAGADQWGSRGG